MSMRGQRLDLYLSGISQTPHICLVYNMLFVNVNFSKNISDG